VENVDETSRSKCWSWQDETDQRQGRVVVQYCRVCFGTIRYVFNFENEIEPSAMVQGLNLVQYRQQVLVT
jgi:hypothetical protein